ncbi:MAG TPA: HAMP domain-containing sensor histidine kinase, partial [Candidatus Krumholzibacterium sp.]|nr:HAMP domain-containing sensor histidine kinase [Candidatus Krumholzibacterium sp.]
HLEEKITSQNRELKEINRKLTDVDRLKSEFLGRISHELRTPLSVIMAYTGTLIEDRGTTIDETIRGEFLQVISDQSNKLLALINDLLDLSKLEVSETMLDVTESSLNEMIKASLAVVRPLAVQAGVVIKIDLDESIPVMRFDPLRIRQICVNLLSNAIKYTSSGDSICIASRLSGTDAVVSVADRGPGIDKDHLSRIFENFTQVDGGSSRKKNGLGIGLRLVYHFVELHRGRVWVDSDNAHGAIFHFSLPVNTDWD